MADPAEPPQCERKPGMGQFDGKVALVTGGSRGIGAECARLLAMRGASVIVGYGQAAGEAEAVASVIRDTGGRAATSGGDARDPATGKAAVAKALETFGGLDILVTSAGVLGNAPLEDIDAEMFRTVYEINVLGTLLTIQAAVPHMTSPGGRIVTFSSRFAVNPPAGNAAYSASKAAVIAMTETFAKELGPRGITVNAVAPGLIETDMTREIVAARGEAMAAQTPLGRIGLPGDVAGVVAFLASDDARWVTGRTVRADGGIV
jgi:3-oxoacyl-[acyl-carrier protein] reductase